MESCFTCLDEITPAVGIYSRAMKLIRDELYDAIFSDEYTAHRDGSAARVPYFSLLRKLHKSRQSELENVTLREERAREELEHTRRQHAKAEAKITKLEAVIKQLRGSLGTEKAEHEALKVSSKKFVENETRDLQCRIEKLELELRQNHHQAEKNEVVLNDAAKYIEGYKKMQEAFKVPFNHQSAQLVKADIGQKTVLKRSLGEAKSLRAQLLGARNAAVAELEAGFAREGSDLEQIKRRYAVSMDEVAHELKMNLDHCAALEASMRDMSQRDQIQHEISGKFKTDDAVIDRFSMSLQVSEDNGQSFFDLGSTPHCTSCNARTMFCPHVVPNGSITIKVPSQSTHIQLTRPIARFAAAKSKKGSKKRKQSKSGRAGSRSGTKPKGAPGNTPGNAANDPAAAQAKGGRAEAGGSATERGDAYQEECALNVERETVYRLPREMETRSMHKLLADFYMSLPPQDKSLVFDEDEDEDEAEVPSRQQAFVTFLDARYGAPAVATSVANDVFAAIQTHASDPHLRVLGHVLNGVSDAVVARHYMYISSILDRFEWEPNPENVDHIFCELYNFCDSDERDQLGLEYESVRTHGVTRENLETFLLGLVANQKEPWMLRGRAITAKYTTMSAGYMTLDDLRDCVTTSFPHFEQEQRGMIDVLFRHSEAQSRFMGGKGGLVPSDRCGEIIAYLWLQSEADEICLAVIDRLSGLSEWKRVQARKAREVQKQKNATLKRLSAAQQAKGAAASKPQSDA